MKEQSRDNSAAWIRVLIPPQGINRTIWHISLSSSTGTTVPTQVEDGNFRLSIRFLEHHPITSPPATQKEVTYPIALTPNFAFKNSSWKPLGSFSSFQFSHTVLSNSATPWTAAHQTSLSSITNSQSLLSLMSIESVMPPNHLILCWVWVFCLFFFWAGATHLPSSALFLCSRLWCFCLFGFTVCQAQQSESRNILFHLFHSWHW